MISNLKKNLTIIVPIYNEEDNIERLCKELDDFLKNSIVDKIGRAHV